MSQRFLLADEVIQFIEGMGASDARFVHQQMTSSAQWDIAHGLGKYPSVMISDSAGSVVIGNVRHVDENNVQLTFAAPFAGSAYLN